MISERFRRPSVDFASWLSRVTSGLVMSCVVLAAASAYAIDNFPRPDFREYQRPELPSPLPRGLSWEMLDLWILLLFLLVATWFALCKRSRTGLLSLAVLSVGYFGFFRHGCVCAVGSIQNITLGLADPHYIVPWSVVAIFCLPLLFSLFFGRVFCSGVCPLGAVQELICVWPVRVPRWFDRVLSCIPWIFLGLVIVYAATDATFLICAYDPFVILFRGMQGTFPMIVIALSLLVIGIFVGRPYCRYLCPYGALLGICAKASKWQTRIAPDACHECKLCESVCPYDAIRAPTQELSVDAYQKSRKQFLLLFVLLPIWIVLGVASGSLLADQLSQRHPTVQLHHLVVQQQNGELSDVNRLPELDRLRLEAFAAHGTDPLELQALATKIQESYQRGACFFGGLVGLIFGGKSISLLVRRKRVGYTTSRSECVACGRCFRYCPTEKTCQIVPLGIGEKSTETQSKTMEYQPSKLDQ
ncbi:MAG: 4Fe-4S binding protein [Thermoguttaceae bacterium]|nr:4Fe-4S binding protein [Thermoguttaceae bacterium]